VTPQRWSQIRELFGAALETPESERPQFLESACGRDSDLRAEVERLLAGNQEPSWQSPATTLFPLATELAPGDTVAHYRIDARLGEGGMGVVYRAQDLKLDRLVALKFLQPHMSADPQQKQRFTQEAKAACALDHANIGVVHGIDETGDGQMFIVMAYYDGETLARRIERGVSTHEAIDIAIQILKALQTANEHGIVHRDIKPHNILLTPDGVVKVIDFGLARVADVTMTLDGTTRGTIAYMSPEQARGEQLDHRTDVWAAGVVLYEMLAKRRPFERDQAMLVVRAILEAEPKELTSVRSDVPRELAQIVRRALAKDRRRRYASADEMARDLKALQSRATPVRQPLYAIPAAGALLLIVVLGLWYAVREYRARWARDVAIPQVERFIAEDNYLAAVDLAREAGKRIPNDVKLAELWPQMSQILSFATDPPGAEVFFKKYAAPESEWRVLGTTPLAKITVPLGFFEWKITKAGYEDFHAAARTPAERLQPPFLPSSSLQKIPLDRKGSVPDGMVTVPRGNLRINISAFGLIGPFSLQDYFIDRYEVTNREFKQFVDRGGYRSREYWKEPFRKDGRTITLEEAMNEFRDSTGQPGPSTWELGSYRDGEEDLPVSGVSWYEASAYAEFVQKKLPTIAHWYYAANLGSAPYVVPASNFSNKGPARVGQNPGIGPSGTYDMAGNVKEWCSNASEDGLRFAQGGAWSDPSYLFTNPTALSPFDRSATNGFRCARYTSPLPAELTGPMHRDFRDYTKEKPVGDELFGAYKSLYAFEPSDLKSSVDSINDSSAHWRVEKVSFRTANGNQRMDAYLFLPKNVSPPYNPVVYFPGQTARLLTSSSNIPLGKNNDSLLLDFVIRSGRAVLYPVYQGTYERPLPMAETPLGRREERVQWSQDVHQSVDYLATRSDMDLSHLGYYGFSLGGLYGPILVALEPRFRVVVWLDGGLRFQPELPESDSINFLPRVKIPVLMVNGRSDFTFPLATLQEPMYRLLGTPEKDKRHVVLDGAHGVFFYHQNEVVREVLAWLDRYAPITSK
jgi:dienelactone hydrolase